MIDVLLTPPPEGDDQLNLATYAQRAYLEHALSVVKGRALNIGLRRKPEACDLTACHRRNRKGVRHDPNRPFSSHP